MSQGQNQAHELPFAQASKGILMFYWQQECNFFFTITNKIQTELSKITKKNKMPCSIKVINNQNPRYLLSQPLRRYSDCWIILNRIGTTKTPTNVTWRKQSKTLTEDIKTPLFKKSLNLVQRSGNWHDTGYLSTVTAEYSRRKFEISN